MKKFFCLFLLQIIISAFKANAQSENLLVSELLSRRSAFHLHKIDANSKVDLHLSNQQKHSARFSKAAGITFMILGGALVGLATYQLASGELEGFGYLLPIVEIPAGLGLGFGGYSLIKTSKRNR